MTEVEGPALFEDREDRVLDFDFVEVIGRELQRAELHARRVFRRQRATERRWSGGCTHVVLQRADGRKQHARRGAALAEQAVERLGGSIVILARRERTNRL